MESETRNRFLKHKMQTQKATTRNKKANRGNIKSSSSKIDQILLQHLLSPHRYRGFSYLAKNERLPPQASPVKVKNRLQYLKRIQEQNASEFLILCSSNNVDTSVFSQPRKLDFEDSDDSDNASDSDDSSEEEDDITSNTTTRPPSTIRTKDFISTMPNNIPSKKYLVNYPDGRYLGVVKLDSGFNENREAFRMSECRRKVIYRKKKATDTTPDPMEDANKLLNRHGFDENSIHRVTLQAKIDELIETLEPDTDTTIFELDEECKAKFVDEKGIETNRVYLGEEDVDGTMWVYFWLMGKNVKPENLSDATLQRDKKRSKADHALQEMHSQFNEQMYQAQQEKANMAKQMAQMQAQLAHLLNGNSSSDDPMPDLAASSEY
jgi:hypothetical protein